MARGPDVESFCVGPLRLHPAFPPAPLSPLLYYSSGLVRPSGSLDKHVQFQTLFPIALPFNSPHIAIVDASDDTTVEQLLCPPGRKQNWA
jgi:hypothetical protein